MPGFFRLRRSMKIMPGLRLNLSKSGMSMSVGPRGAHYTVGPRGTRATVGIPGTGVSYTTYSSHHARRAAEQHARNPKSPAAAAPSLSSPSQSTPMTPTAKLGWGIALLVLGLLFLIIVWPIGLLALVAGAILMWVASNQRKEPKWRIRNLLHKAVQNPASRNQFLQEAINLDPENPEALAACAENAYQSQDWPKAGEFYEHYLQKAPDDEQAELHLGLSYLNSGQVDAALQRLEKIRARSSPGERPGLIDAVAIAFLQKGDPSQALEILKTLPLRRQTLDQLLQQGLFLRAMAHYCLHQTSSAMTDLDRLYAISPEYPGLAAVREAMKSGTFSVSSVKFQVG